MKRGRILLATSAVFFIAFECSAQSSFQAGDTTARWWTSGEGPAATGHYLIESGDVSRQVDDVSYEIRMRYAAFDPLRDGEPAIPAPLTLPVEQPGDAATPHIVQFHTQPIQGYRDAIHAAGGVISKYIADHAYLVHITPESRAAVENLAFVRWVGEYKAAYKLEEILVDLLTMEDPALPTMRYHVQVFERGRAQKEAIAAFIEGIGGQVDPITPNGFRLQTALSAEQLLAVAHRPEVIWIDRWGAPEDDMNIAREIGGANYVEGIAGYTGQGVRAEVMDGNLDFNHQDFQHHPPIAHGPHDGSQSHGTATYGINFGDGTGDSTARGMAPDAQGIFADYSYLTDRYQHTAELVQSPYFAVYQSNSWGDPRTTQYDSTSMEMDDLLLLNDIIICQSQSNSGWQDSRPQAWAKNIVSVGGVQHQNTQSKPDDRWGGGASIGPAADGRIKPDLTHFYENIRTTSPGSGYTSGFGGTSGATPIIAGHFAILFQMWSEGIFGNAIDTNGTVFDNRPHMSTAKALMINTADPYDWTQGGANADLQRHVQGWGMADIRQAYDDREAMFIVNEDAILEELETASYQVVVDPNTPEFRATLVYTDVAGTTSSQQHRINDLSLKVTSPGGTVYWGNRGLDAGLWSTAGGGADTKNTVENVRIQNPQTGAWSVEVIAAEINEDSHLETPETDADFALVVAGVSVEGEVAAVTGVDVVVGTLLSGDAGDLEVSDDAHVRTRSGFGQTLVDLHNMTADVTAVTSVGSPSAIDLTVESRIDQPSGTGQVWMYDWNAGAFDLIGTHPLGSTDAQQVFAGIPAGDYIDGGGTMVIRLKHIVFVPFLAFTFESWLDLVEAEVR